MNSSATSTGEEDENDNSEHSEVLDATEGFETDPAEELDELTETEPSSTYDDDGDNEGTDQSGSNQVNADCDEDEDGEEREQEQISLDLSVQPDVTRKCFPSSRLILISIVLLPILAYVLFHLHAQQLTSQDAKEDEHNDIEIDYSRIDEIDKKYPGTISLKKMTLIRRRLDMMRREVSVLMLLGRTRDSHCNLDFTFCIGQRIANVTKTQFAYIDASSPNLQGKKIENELSNSLGIQRYTVMIDNLEKLPGTEVMSLFQFIDKDQYQRRRGMLLLVVYTGTKFGENTSKMREAEIAQKILTSNWSPFVPEDSLNSVISRMSGSIVKIH